MEPADCCSLYVGELTCSLTRNVNSLLCLPSSSRLQQCPLERFGEVRHVHVAGRPEEAAGGLGGGPWLTPAQP